MSMQCKVEKRQGKSPELAKMASVHGDEAKAEREVDDGGETQLVAVNKPSRRFPGSGAISLFSSCG